MSSLVAIRPRLTSLDQFRGYTVAGMCLVNFLAPFVVIHSILKHNDTYFSYADTIMPGFLFVVGFAFRLTYLKRRQKSGRLQTASSYVRRSGKLLLLSLLIYCFVGDIPRWFQFREMPPEFGRRVGEQRERKSEEGQKESMLRIPGTDPGHHKPTPTPNPSSLAPLPLPLSAPDPPRIAASIERFRAWRALSWQRQLLVHWRILAAKLIKSELWETLAIIGATQLVILPWIGCRFWTRLLVMATLGVAHCLLSYWFNWDFLYGVNGNWMSNVWMTGDDRGWDGGIFGPINWGIVMLGGTLAYDLVAASASPAAAISKLAMWGFAFMAAGYSLSCLTRLYDLSASELAEMRQRHLRQEMDKATLSAAIGRQRASLESLKASVAQRPASAEELATIERLEGTIVALEDRGREFADLSLAESPVMPPWERLRGRTIGDLVAEPPFVAPPTDDPRIDPSPCIEHRLRNYWMLGKRMPNLSFTTFATGFQFALFGLFVAACDVGGWQVGLFRTFGTNPLAAYLVHGGMALVLATVIPHNASIVFCLTGFAVTFAITYLLVRLLEKRGIYWRL